MILCHAREKKREREREREREKGVGVCMYSVYLLVTCTLYLASVHERDYFNTQVYTVDLREQTSGNYYCLALLLPSVG